MIHKLLFLLLFSWALGACNTAPIYKTQLAAGNCCKVDAEATCTGDKPCNACKNCKYCKHCSKEGGKCGVCK